MHQVILKIVFKGSDFDIVKLDIDSDQIGLAIKEPSRKGFLIVHLVQDSDKKSKFSYHIYDSLAPEPLKGSHVIVITDAEAGNLLDLLKVTNSKNFNSLSNLLFRSPEMVGRILCRIELNYISKARIGSRIFREHNKSVEAYGGLVYHLALMGVAEK